ncbi:MAG TPA: glycosyltransferase family 9 protein [Chloroflexota bacterium]
MEGRPGEAYRRILLILLAPIGDTLFATPAIRGLRRVYPQARIDALVWDSNRAVLENNPDVNRLTVFQPRLGCFGRLRRQHYDLALHFAPFHDYFGLLSGIPRRLALPAPWLFWLWPHRNRRWRLTHAREHYLDVLRPLGVRVEDKRLVLKVSGRQEAFAEEYLAGNGHQPGELLVGIHAGGSGFSGAKRWGPEGFAWAARQLGRDRHVRLVFFGGAADAQLARAVVRAGVPDGWIDTCGRVSLSQAIGLLGRLDLFVGNDSGPLHLAAALDVPVVGIYGPTSIMNFHPIGCRVRAVFGAVPCPAGYGFIGTRAVWSRRSCRGECLDSVEPAQVLAAARDLLAEHQCHPERRAKGPLARAAATGDSSLDAQHDNGRTGL